MLEEKILRYRNYFAKMFNPAGSPQSQAALEANQLISDHTSAYSSVDYLSNIQPHVTRLRLISGSCFATHLHTTSPFNVVSELIILSTYFFYSYSLTFHIC